MFQKIKQTYKGFVVTKILPIKEIQATLFELIHEKSGAVILHICCKDVENAFCFAFPTYPSSSNGAPHILEHIVLCGSKKYPIKDPFFAMMRRSVPTFMNAMTGADFTLYLASSQVEKDFYHLMDVYLDAVFFPELKEMSFLQEGHRLEWEDPKDPHSSLVYKGVVFNEMKGSMSSCDSRLWHHLFAHLFPDLPYAYNSGGDPEQIPSLSYQELLEFYRTFYHPSHCLFYFYGNLPLTKHLDFLEERLLNQITKASYLPPLPSQKRLSTPIFCEAPYPISQEEASLPPIVSAYAWLTCSITEQTEILALLVLHSILMEHDGSLLKKELLATQLAGHIEAYLDTEISEVPWVIVAKGMQENQTDPLRKILFQTLKSIASNPIPKKEIESALHQIEFSRREITGEGLPYGLSLFLRGGLLKLQGCEPEAALKIHTLFQELKEKLKDLNYLPSLIEKHFLQNPHFVQLKLEADPLLLQKEEEREKKTLQEIQQTLSKAQKNQILTQMQKLQEYQDLQEKQDINCLPIIQLKDLPTEPKQILLKEKDPIYFHDSFTNHIFYIDLIFDLPKLNATERKYLPIFAHLFSEVGVGKKSYLDVLEEKNTYTGGVDAFVSIGTKADSKESFTPFFTLKGKSLYRNTSKLLSLLYRMLTSTHFTEKQRIQELLLQQKTHLENRLSKHAMHYASSLSVTPFSYANQLQDLWHGYGFFQTVRSLFSQKKAFEELLATCESLLQRISAQAKLQIVIGCDVEHLSTLQSHRLEGLLDFSTSHKSSVWKERPTSKNTSPEGYLIASSVAFTSSGYQLVPYSHPDTASLCVVAELLQNLVLHPLIREKGGAYGSGACFSPSTGNFSFYAYRDPNLHKTLQAFQRSLEVVGEGKFSDQDLLEAKLGIIQGLDTPIPPKSRATTAFHWQKSGKSWEKRLAFRNRLFSLKKEEILQAVQIHLLPNFSSFHTVCFSNSELFQRENSFLKKAPFVLHSC